MLSEKIRNLDPHLHWVYSFSVYSVNRRVVIGFEIYDEFYLLFEHRSQYISKNPEIPILYFCASMKLCTQPATNENCQKITDFSWLKCPSCMKIVSVLIWWRHTGLDIRGCIDLIPDNFIFHKWRTFQLEKINNFWAVGKCSKVACTIYAGTRKLLQDFWPPQLEQLISFVLIRA